MFGTEAYNHNGSKCPQKSKQGQLPASENSKGGTKGHSKARACIDTDDAGRSQTVCQDTLDYGAGNGQRRTADQSSQRSGESDISKNAASGGRLKAILEALPNLAEGQGGAEVLNRS